MILGRDAVDEEDKNERAYHSPFPLELHNGFLRYICEMANPQICVHCDASSKPNVHGIIGCCHHHSHLPRPPKTLSSFSSTTSAGTNRRHHPLAAMQHRSS